MDFSEARKNLKYFSVQKLMVLINISTWQFPFLQNKNSYTSSYAKLKLIKFGSKQLMITNSKWIVFILIKLAGVSGRFHVWSKRRFDLFIIDTEEVNVFKPSMIPQILSTISQIPVPVNKNRLYSSNNYCLFHNSRL